MNRLAVSSLLCAGCSLTFPMGEYEEGTGSGAMAAGAGSGGVAGAGGGPGGQPATAGGAGGQLDCGNLSDPPISELQQDFDRALGSDLALHDCGVVQDGKLVFEPAVAGQFCWLYNISPRRLTCDALTFRLIDVGSQENGMQRFIYLNAVGSDADVFVLQEANGFNFMALQAVEDSFLASDDAWWRLRADQDTLFFETSPDGATWKLKGSGPSPFSLDSVLVRIGAGIWQDIATPMPVSYDCLNAPPPCP